MRICQVIDRLSGGGQERVATEVARCLAGRVDHSALIATRGGGDYEAVLTGTGVEVFLGRRRSRFDLAGWAAVYRWVLAGRFDVLHTHSPGSLRAAVLLRRMPGVEYRIASHIQMLPPRGTKFRETAVRWHRTCRDEIAITFVTNPVLRTYLVDECGYDDGRIAELPNPVRFDDWISIRKPSAPSDGDATLRVVMVAQWRMQKDHETAIRAAAILRERGIPARWSFIGEVNSAVAAGAMSLIERLGLQQTVEVLGRRTDVPDLLAAADIGVLATQFEGSPVAVAEYAAAGLPSVVTRVEGTNHILSEENGIIGVPPRDPYALAEAVAQLVDPQLRDKLGARARAHFAAKADASVVADRLIEYYAGVARNTGPVTPSIVTGAARP